MDYFSTVFLGFVLTVVLIQFYQFYKLFREMAREPFIEDPYDFVIRPETYDSLEISDAMTFKEKPLSHIKKLLSPSPIPRKENHHTRDGVEAIVQSQLGDQYRIVYWRETPTHYDIIIHAPTSWVGILIVVAKKDTWEPHVIGYIMQDKLSHISGFNK